MKASVTRALLILAAALSLAACQTSQDQARYDLFLLEKLEGME